MRFNKHSEGDICHMSLVGDIKIYDAVSYKQEMFSGLDQFQGVKLDLSQIEEIDASGFQLLVLLRKETRDKGMSFQIDGLSSSVSRLLEIYRLNDWFQSQN